MIARFFRNATFNLVAEISNRLANGVIAILISKFLSVSNFGSYNLALSFFTVGSLLSFWGFGNLLIREVSKKPENYGKYFFNFGVIRIVFSTLAVISIILISIFFNYTQETFNIIVIVCIGIIAEALKNLCFSAFNAFEQTQFVGIVYMISSLVKILLSAVLIRYQYGILEIAMMNTAVNFLGAFALLWLAKLNLPPIKFDVDWEFIKTQTILAFPLFLIALFSIAENRLDVILLSGYYSETIVGYYSAGVVLESALMIFPEGIRNAIFPVFSKLAAEDTEKSGRVYSLLTKFIILITLPITVGGILLAPQILSIIYKADFVKSVPIFRILMISFPFFSFVVLSIRLLNAYDKDKRIAEMYAVVMGVSIVLYLIVIPKYQSIGTAFVRLATILLLTSLCYYEVRKIIPNGRLLPAIIRGSGASFVMGFILQYISHWHLALTILIGFLIYLVMLLILNTFSKAEWMLIKSSLLQRKI